MEDLLAHLSEDDLTRMSGISLDKPPSQGVEDNSPQAKKLRSLYFGKPPTRRRKLLGARVKKRASDPPPEDANPVPWTKEEERLILSIAALLDKPYKGGKPVYPSLPPLQKTSATTTEEPTPPEGHCNRRIK